MTTAQFEVHGQSTQPKAKADWMVMAYTRVPEAIVTGFLAAPLVAFTVLFFFWSRNAGSLLEEIALVAGSLVAGFAVGFISGLLFSFWDSGPQS